MFQDLIQSNRECFSLNGYGLYLSKDSELISQKANLTISSRLFGDLIVDLLDYPIYHSSQGNTSQRSSFAYISCIHVLYLEFHLVG